MKIKVHYPIVTGVLLLAGAANVHAQMYLNGEAGAAFPQQVTIRNSGGATATFNPGVRGGFSFGYNINPSFAAEIETAAIWNSVDKVGGSSISGSADLYQIPLLANLIYKTPVKSGFSAYIGAGAGGVASLFSVSSPGSGGGGITGPGTGVVSRATGTFKASGGFGSGGVNGSDTDYTFAYQGIAGVKYNIAANMDIGLGYKFLGTLDHHWTIQGNGLSTDGLFTHSVLATFTFRF